jgi:hypothetical protein
MLPEAIAIVMAPTDTSRFVFLYHLVIIASNVIANQIISSLMLQITLS